MLVELGRDEVKGESFCRLIGGSIDFGERGAEAVRRELREELGVDCEVERHLATLENLFTYEGEPGHEIVLIYECSIRDDQLDSRDEWQTEERGPSGVITHRLAWRPLDSFRSGGEILYPEGLLTLLGDQEHAP